MSYSTLYLVFKTKARPIAEYHNGWGTGPAAWTLMSMVACGKDESMPPYIGGEEAQKEFWHRLYSPNLTDAQRLGILLTYDGSIIEPNGLAQASVMCRQFHRDILAKTHWTWSHFGAIGETLAELANKGVDKRSIGVGLNCTSVCDVWQEYNYLKGKPKKPLWGIFGELGAVKSRSKEVAEKERANVV